jgi:hypothetical protein
MGREYFFTVRTMYDAIRTYSFESLINGLMDYSPENFIELNPGYYKGFQIIANKRALEEAEWKRDSENYNTEDSFFDNLEVMGFTGSEGLCEKYPKSNRPSLFGVLETQINTFLKNHQNQLSEVVGY